MSAKKNLHPDTSSYDTVIIGGGFYGLRIAQFLAEELGQKKILVIEKEDAVMSRASYNNQARVHNGYHYPRSVLTALRSRVNLPVFMDEYDKAVVKDFTKYYGVARNFSKVSASQFSRFFERIGSRIAPADEMMKYFDKSFVESVYEVDEYAFNSKILKDIVVEKCRQLNIVIKVQENVEKIAHTDKCIDVMTDLAKYHANYVLNTSYSSINLVNRASGLPIIPLKHELTEMCLVKLPAEMSGMAFTIMCGPFYSIMPFPDKNLHTLSHVRYTPHSEWYDNDAEEVLNSHEYLKKMKINSHFPQMSADLQRFMPALGKKVSYTGASLWEIKTVLPQSEDDDSRPILYKENYGGIKNYVCIMGGKIDNVYDVFKELRITYGK